MSKTHTNVLKAVKFECGCWLHEVGGIRLPPVTEPMRCPIHRALAIYFAMTPAGDADA